MSLWRCWAETGLNEQRAIIIGFMTHLVTGLYPSSKFKKQLCHVSVPVWWAAVEGCFLILQGNENPLTSQEHKHCTCWALSALWLINTGQDRTSFMHQVKFCVPTWSTSSWGVLFIYTWRIHQAVTRASLVCESNHSWYVLESEENRTAGTKMCVRSSTYFSDLSALCWCLWALRWTQEGTGKAEATVTP